MTALVVMAGLEGALVLGALLLSRRDVHRAALLLLVASAPLEVYRTEVGGINLSLFRLSLLLAGAVAIWPWPSRLRAVVSSPLVIGYAVMAALIGVSAVTLSENSFLAVRLLAAVVLGTVAIAVVALLVRRTSIDFFARALVIGAALPLAAACYQALLPKLGHSPELPLLAQLPAAEGLYVLRDPSSSVVGLATRLKATFGDPNHYGVYLLFPMTAALGLARLRWLQDRRWHTIAYSGAALAVASSLLATYSRSAWLGATVALMLLVATLGGAALRSMVWSPRVIARLAAGAVALVVLVIPFTSTVLERLDPNSAVNRISNTTHGSTARAAVDLFADHPGFGVGAADLGLALRQGPRTSGAHSTYLTVAAELGVVGLLAIAVLAGLASALLVKALRASRNPERPVTAALLAGYGGFIASNAFYDLWWDDFHWIMLGGVAALSLERFPRLFRWERKRPEARHPQTGGGELREDRVGTTSGSQVKASGTRRERSQQAESAPQPGHSRVP